MSTLRVALGVSLVLHAALGVVLALAAVPAVPPPRIDPTRVTLWVPSDAGDPGPVADAESASPIPSAVEDPSVSASFARPLPLPESRLAAPSYAPPSVVVPRTTARPIPSAATDPAAPIASFPRSPDRLPDPSAILAEIGPAGGETAPEDAGPAAAETPTVETVASFGRRTPSAQPVPPFPEVLRRTGQEAEVTVRLKIDPTGAVTDVAVERSSGNTGVDNAVVRAVRGYLFERADGDTIDEGLVTFHFRLQKGF